MRALEDEFKEALELVKRKNKDYGNAKDVLGHLMARLFSNGLNLTSSSDFQEFSIINLILTKLCRLCNLWGKPKDSRNFESLEDTLLDLGNYAFILKNMTRNRREEI